MSEHIFILFRLYTIWQFIIIMCIRMPHSLLYVVCIPYTLYVQEIWKSEGEGLRKNEWMYLVIAQIKNQRTHSITCAHTYNFANDSIFGFISIILYQCGHNLSPQIVDQSIYFIDIKRPRIKNVPMNVILVALRGMHYYYLAIMIRNSKYALAIFIS